MKVTVEAVTGQEYSFELGSEDTVSVLKSLIWKQGKVLPCHQGLIFNGKQLDVDDQPLKNYGVTSGSKLNLALLARSGPLRTVVTDSAPVATPAANTDFSASVYNEAQRLDSSCISQSGGELDLSFTADRRLAARQRAEENLRTMAKMRELRQNLEKLKLEKKNRTNADISTEATRVRRTSYPSSSLGTIGKPKPLLQVAPALLSAPEDTSAKESSAGETEYEEWRPSGPVSLQDYFLRHQVGCSFETEDSVGFHSYTASSCRRSTMPDQRPTSSRPAAARLGVFRVVSSSSDPESCGAVWTGSDAEEDVLYTAEEGVSGEKGELEGEFVDEFYSGNSDLDEGTAGFYFAQKQRDTPSDPSELSSGMIICDLSNDFRRVKVKRKHHLPGKTAAACSSARTNLEMPASRSWKRSQLRGQAGGWRNRPRSRPRQPATLTVNACSQGKVVGPSTGESSSDEKDGWSSGGGAKPPANYGFPGNSLTNARKFAGPQGRFLKYRLTGSSVGGQTEAPSVVRHHKLPQSSQSQLRCNTCGCKLSICATYQCRCGKTLCTRHRSQDTHICSYDLTKSADAKRTVKLQELSD